MPAKPRVALVTWDVGPPGSQAGIPAEIVLGGRDRFEFVVVSRTLPADLRPLVTWLRAPAPAAPFRLRWAVFFATAAVQVRRAKADLVHTRGPAPPIPNRVDLASVNFCHAAFHETGGAGSSRLRWLTETLERHAYRGSRTRLVEMETPGAAEAFRRLLPGVPTTVVPLSYDTERFRPDPGSRERTRQEMGVPQQAVAALFSGRDAHAKGLRFAIDGLAVARRAGGAPLELWVAGYPDSAYVRRLAKRAGVADHVRSLGWREDLAPLYAAADMLVLPTVYEQGSRTSHEAAASGLPLLVTPVHGAAGLIAGGEAGIAIRRDAEVVGAAMAKLAGDSGLRDRMGRAARERALEVTAGADHVRDLLDLYDRLTA